MVTYYLNCFNFLYRAIQLIVQSFTLFRQNFSSITTGAKPALGPNCIIPQINCSDSDLDKTLPTRFERLKYHRKVCAICIICRFHKLAQCFNYMPNFKQQDFKIKEIYVIVLSISSVYFYLDIFLVQVTWWFLASDGSEIQTFVENFRPINLNFTSNICYLISHTLI